MTSEMKGNADMHMDGVHTFYLFLCGSTAEIVDVSIYMVGTKCVTTYLILKDMHCV
jgi:hypothetical protein